MTFPSRFTSSRLLPLLLGAAVVGIGPSAGAQAAPPPPGCPAAEHRQFDFWLGEWDVRVPNGSVAGTNRITRMLEGCALLEEWTGRNSRGMSINFYDAGNRRWHQTWIDDRGQPLYLAGSFRDGAMVLEGVAPGNDGKPARQRITWTTVAPNVVRQHWEVSTDDGATWTTAFDGRYTRR